MVRAGWEIGDVRSWALPKLQMMTLMAQRQELQTALTQAAAAAAPDKINQAIAGIERELGGTMRMRQPDTGGEAPKSAEEFEQLLRARKEGS